MRAGAQGREWGALCLPGAYKLLDGGNVPAWNSKNKGSAEPLARIATGLSSVMTGEVGLAEAGGVCTSRSPAHVFALLGPWALLPSPILHGKLLAWVNTASPE